MFSPNPITQSRIGSSLVIISIWIFTGILTSIYEYLFLANFPDVTETSSLEGYSFMGSLITAAVWAFLGGTLFATLELFYFQEKLTRRTFLEVVSMKMVIYFLMLVILNVLASFLYNSIVLSAPFWDKGVIAKVITFSTGLAFWYPLLPFLLLVLLTLFFIQINFKFGRGELWKFIRGEYFHPKEEIRIFMFLDLNSSTTIAERLGHVKFFNLLNDFFQDITNDIILNKGEIVDYVGDEIIVTWNLAEGLQEGSCIKCFYEIEKKIESLGNEYETKYGLKPSFKAGIHCGSATIGEIGKIKKEIVFSGDVMNTTARILSLCNEKGYSLMISEDLKEKLPEVEFPITELGETILKGRKSPTKVFGVNAA